MFFILSDLDSRHSGFVTCMSFFHHKWRSLKKNSYNSKVSVFHSLLVFCSCLLGWLYFLCKFSVIMQKYLIRLIDIVISTKPRPTFKSPWNICTRQYYHFRLFLWGLCFAFVIVSETVVAPHITLLGDHISLIRAFTCGANNLKIFQLALMLPR